MLNPISLTKKKSIGTMQRMQGILNKVHQVLALRKVINAIEEYLSMLCRRLWDPENLPKGPGYDVYLHAIHASKKNRKTLGMHSGIILV